MVKKQVIPCAISPSGYRLTEQETRASLLSRAKYFGYDIELKQIFDKYDRALSKCTNVKEREHLAQCGSAEIHNLMDMIGSLEVNGKIIIPAKE